MHFVTEVEKGTWSMSFDIHNSELRQQHPYVSRPREGKFKYLDWCIYDDGEGVPSEIFTNPETYEPKLDATGKIPVWDCWGIAVLEMGELQKRRMNTQYYYGDKEFCLPNCPKYSPEEQFVKIQMRKKKQKLAHPDHIARRTQLAKCDYILRIQLWDCNPPGWIFRRFKVSGGVPLFTLSDKIINPVMGWCRNYHSFYFMDRLDGSTYGPKESNSIDMTHLYTHGWNFLDSQKYCLADILQDTNGLLHYVYDLGDTWRHDIICEQILPAESSDGKVVVYEGGGACPPEDSNGFHGGGGYYYMKALQSNSVNYKEASSSFNYNGKRFNPLEFSLPECRKRVKEALSSTLSMLTQPKIVSSHLNPSVALEQHYSPNSKTEALVSHPWAVDEQNSVVHEVVRTSRDYSHLALCCHCGNPHDLKVCSSCRGIRYCSRECQVADWRNHKPNCKPINK